MQWTIRAAVAVALSMQVREVEAAFAKVEGIDS